jgi:hypothetical protein
MLQLLRNAQQADFKTAFAFNKAAKANNAAPKPAELVWAYQPPINQDWSMAWDITEALLSKMIASAKEHGAEFWLIQIGGDIEEDYRDSERDTFIRANKLSGFNYASKRYAGFAAKHGVSYLNLSPAMRDYAASAQLPLRGFFNTQPFKGHWNQDGSEAAAKIIGNELLRSSRFLASQSHKAQ